MREKLLKPFIKWAGGKRWLIASGQLNVPEFNGKYIEPFLGGGAVFFHVAPKRALLSDLNPRLIETYNAIKDDWQKVDAKLRVFQRKHCADHYYEERDKKRKTPHTRAAQFLYLNRTCFNGLYRENKAGKFNVPIGTKTQVLLPDDNFEATSKILQSAELRVSDFSSVMDEAKSGDLVFLDPPYTTAHNKNGFLKYNQNIFSWEDQLRLRECVISARSRGAKIIMTNANHASIVDLYSDVGSPKVVSRQSVMSGSSSARGSTTEAMFVF